MWSQPFMTIMRCPKCGREADAPEEIVDQGEMCYKCGVALIIASEEVSAEREKNKENKMKGTAIGACVGMLFVFLIGIMGGSLGMGIVGAVAGAFLGLVVGTLRGILEGLFYSKIFSDPSWVSFSIKVVVVMFSLAGFISGISGNLVKKDGEPVTLMIGCIGGLCLGGYVGRAVAGRKRGASD